MISRSSLLAAAAVALLLTVFAPAAGARVRTVPSVPGVHGVGARVTRPAAPKGHFLVHADPISAFAHPFGTKPPVTAHAAAAAGLATTWCGTPRSTDYTATSLGSLPQVKVVYAYPSGSASRFDALKNWIQADVATIADRVAAASGAKETVRFDVGSDCPNPLSYVDIASVQLPQTQSQLLALNYVDRFKAIEADIKADAPQLNATGGIRHYAVYADYTMPPTGDRSGVGAQYPDDFPDPSNRNNGDAQVAVIYGLETNPNFVTTQGDTTDASDYMLHELTHTLGAVQNSAPHSSGASHCWDEHDVMCYDDGGPYFKSGGGTGDLHTLCAQTLQALDCGGDDYFNATPAPGSYLATHWDAARSTFLCPLARCQTAGAPPVAKLDIPSAPPGIPLVGWSGAPFVLSAAGSTDDSGIAAYEWDVANYDGRIDQTTAAPNLPLTFRDSTPGVAGQVKLGVWTIDVDGAISNAYVQVPIYPPAAFLSGTPTRQKLRTVRTRGLTYSVYGGGGTVRVTATVASSLTRRLHLSSRTLGRTRVLPASTQLTGHLRFSKKVRRRLAHARSVHVSLRASLTPIGVGERRAAKQATIVLR
jgi:hypothetical protein